ncbi:MAG: extracellular solute-binding protein [Christensenellaceae bacterium]
MNKTGFPIVNEPIVLKGLVSKNVNVTDWNEHPALKEMERLTGIKIEWECVPDAGFEEKRNLAFASNELPDIIIRAKISPQLEMKYAANKQLLALDDYMEYAPNFSKLMADDAAIEKGVRLPDGHIYSLPQLNKTEGNLIHHYWINKTWLDNLDLKEPTTTDELYDTLVAFRDKDPNGNNKKDEIPYAGVNKNYPHRMFYDLLGSWGFGINGVLDSDYAFSWLDIDDAGKVRFIGREDKFKNMVEYYNKLWSEGLIDKESYAQDQAAVSAKVNADQVGFVARAQNTQWMGAAAENYVQPPVLTGPFGDRAMINVESNVQMTGVAVITTANKYPEATMRWLDYFYSEEGTALVRLGIEGKSYKKVDGKYELLDEIKHDPTGLTLDQAIGKWGIFPGGYLPQYITNQVDQSAAQLPQTKAANEVIKDFVVPFEKVPRLKFTEEESIRLGTYAQDIVGYATENVVKFITGERSLAEWDAYVAELNKMQIDDYIKINQDAYERWKN